MKRYYKYAEGVDSGKILSCEALRNAVDRFERDLVGMKKRGARWIFDEKEADRIIDFLEALQQFEEPFAGEYLLLQPWECFFLAQLYGWRDKKTRARRFRKALLFVGRKQGKTILASALTLYEILTKPGIEAYSLATKQEIANKALRNLKAFVARDDDLREMLKVYSYSIVNQGNFSIFRPLSRDSSLDGLNPAYVIIDELAAQRDGSAYTALTSGMGTRSEPLTVIISTAGYGLNNPLIEEYEYSKKILDGTIEDDSVLAMVYEYDKADTWDDLSTLLKSCPNLGVSVQLGYFDEELRQARVIPKKAAEYKVKYCNLWQSANDTWIPDKLWMRCVRAAQKYKPEISADMLAQAPCIIALDYSTIWDWTALSRYYYLKQLEKYLAFHRFYIPGDQVETKAYLETPSLRAWIEKGLVVPTPGECIDHTYLYKDLEADLKTSKVSAVVYDPARVRDFEVVFGARCTIVPFSQKVATMSPAAKAWEKAIVDGLIIDDSPILRWMVSCAINKTFADSGRYQITKQGSGKYGKRIDGVITSIMAFATLSQQVLIDAQPRPPMLDLTQIKY